MRTKALILCLSVTGCVTIGLGTQIQLRHIADKARAECSAFAKPCVDMVAGQTSACVKARSVCLAAQQCVKSLQSAENATQTLQEARSRGEATPELTLTAVGSEAAARAICKSAGGW